MGALTSSARFLNARSHVRAHARTAGFTIDLSRCEQLVIKLDVEQPTVTTFAKLQRDVLQVCEALLRT